MYRIRTKGYSKQNAGQRWALPDRVFFACGACHILAYAFLERYGAEAGQALWLKPAPGFTGNHIVIATDDWVFDYHGYSARTPFLDHTFRRARHFWPGWDATLIELPREVLISEPLSRTYDGLWLREPGQFLHDALPRARAYLDRFPPALPPRRSVKRALIRSSGRMPTPCNETAPSANRPFEALDEKRVALAIAPRGLI